LSVIRYENGQRLVLVFPSNAESSSFSMLGVPHVSCAPDPVGTSYNHTMNVFVHRISARVWTDRSSTSYSAVNVLHHL